jgi:spore germination protein YaaH
LPSRSATSLSLGAQGDEIAHLQDRLRQLGYDPGESDGCYGYLTHAAVRALQRDFRLRVDGVIGPQVRALLNHHDLPDRRRIYTLRTGETLTDAARALEVSVQALRLMNRLPVRARGYQGQRLICRTHYVLACLSPTALEARSTYNSLSMWSAIVLPLVTVTEGKLHISVLSSNAAERVASTKLPLWLVVQPAHLHPGSSCVYDIAPLLRWRKARRTAIRQLLEIAEAHQAGIWLDFAYLGWGDATGYLELVNSLRQALSANRWPIMVTLPLPGGQHRRRWWLTDIDYRKLTSLADKVVIGSHVAQTCCDSFALYRQRIESVLNMIPGWKALLGIGLRAEERDEQGTLIREVSYAKALATAYLAGEKPHWDPERRLLSAQIKPKALKSDHLQSDSKTSTTAAVRSLWLPGRDALVARLGLAQRWCVDGVALWPVGEEETRIWSVMPNLLVPAHDSEPNASKR